MQLDAECLSAIYYLQVAGVPSSCLAAVDSITPFEPVRIDSYALNFPWARIDLTCNAWGTKCTSLLLRFFAD